MKRSTSAGSCAGTTTPDAAGTAAAGSGGSSPPDRGGEVRGSGVAPRGGDAGGRARGLGVERRVRAQDRGLEPPQLLAGFQAVFLCQQPPPFAVGRERIGDLPAPVEGEHELRAGALAQGLRSHQAGQLANELDVAPRAEVGLDAVLPCRQPALAVCRR